MKILHTADLHLDSPFGGRDVLYAQQRREAQRQTLRRIFRLAGEERCDLILIAGDLFDSKYVTPETASLTLALMASASCPIVIAPGNHDPYVEGSFYRRDDLPKNVHVFSSPELQCIELEAIRTRVWGYAFTSAVMNTVPEGLHTPAERDGSWQLLCAHADLSSPLSRYCPLTVGDIARFGFDYAALGHIHNPPEGLSRGATEIRYCGFAEGRSFDECGEGGVLLVTLEEGRAPSVERRVISQNEYRIEELDVSTCADEGEMRVRIAQAIARLSGRESLHLRLCLCGSADPEAIATLLSDTALGGDLASLELWDLTLPTIDAAALEKDITLRGALYRALYAGLIDDDPAVRRKTVKALQIGLAAIDGRQIPDEEGADL